MFPFSYSSISIKYNKNIVYNNKKELPYPVTQVGESDPIREPTQAKSSAPAGTPHDPIPPPFRRKMVEIQIRIAHPASTYTIRRKQTELVGIPE